MIQRHSGQYDAVLVSDRWRAVRAEAIRRAGYRCVRCGRDGRLDVHHAHGYRNLGRERPEELQALCRSCHDWVHAQRRVFDAGCLGVLFWVVIIAIALEVAWWLASTLVTAALHHFGVF
jgi:hypothetical protein